MVEMITPPEKPVPDDAKAHENERKMKFNNFSEVHEIQQSNYEGQMNFWSHSDDFKPRLRRPSAYPWCHNYVK